MQFIPYALPIFIHVCTHTGSPEGVTLLEFEAIGEEIPEEIPPPTCRNRRRRTGTERLTGVPGS
jgi:hypothetical protein